MWWIIAIVFWMLCGLCAYGISLAYFQRKYSEIAFKHRHEDILLACISGLLGPIGVFNNIVILKYNQGLLFKPISKQESWDAAQAKWPSLLPDSIDKWKG